MAELAHSNWLRVLAYLVAALCSFVAGRRERRRAGDVDGVWHPFWLLTAGLLLTLAIGRIGDVGQLLADIGRSQAADGGWYASRRPFQAAIVGLVTTTWLVFVTVAVWRVPERRRRYLPMCLVMVTLLAFAAIRVVSLHQVDAVLYHRDAFGIRRAAVIELVLLAGACITTAWIPAPREQPVASETQHT